MIKILVVEDEQSIAEMVKLCLSKNGYMCETVNDGMAATQKIEEKRYDLILLDIMLPDNNGLRLLEHIRAMGKRENVIIVSARNSLEDKVYGLENGADDYLPKPFHTAELIARVKSVLRRGRTAGELLIEFGNVSINPESRTVTVGGKQLSLVKKEFDILLYFMQRPRHMVDKAVLAEAVWGDYADDSDNFQFVYAQIKNLRRKLSDAEATVEITAVYGFGYKLTIKEE